MTNDEKLKALEVTIWKIRRWRNVVSAIAWVCLAVVVALYLLACSPPHPAPPPAPGDPTCPAACSHLRELGCEAGQPTQAGEPCEAWCEELEAMPGPGLELGCIATAPSCSAADACG